MTFVFWWAEAVSSKIVDNNSWHGNIDAFDQNVFILELNLIFEKVRKALSDVRISASGLKFQSKNLELAHSVSSSQCTMMPYLSALFNVTYWGDKIWEPNAAQKFVEKGLHIVPPQDSSPPLSNQVSHGVSPARMCLAKSCSHTTCNLTILGKQSSSSPWDMGLREMRMARQGREKKENMQHCLHFS